MEGGWVILSTQLTDYTANIVNAIFTIFTCVPISTAILLYYFHLNAAPSTVE